MKSTIKRNRHDDMLQTEQVLDIDFEDFKYKHRFILRKLDKKVHRPRSQYISENAFIEDGYKKIINKINY